ncbi:MAG: hypothetical protein DMG32_02710 [Acidobacteria bacterium]|nr:MAG: hypothetical protein DMG32_02710 [Acidobacteriota bacterium]
MLEVEVLSESGIFGEEFPARAQKTDMHVPLIGCIGEERSFIRPFVVRALTFTVPCKERYQPQLREPEKFFTDMAFWYSVVVGESSGGHAEAAVQLSRGPLENSTSELLISAHSFDLGLK